jgi:hypothetical protein
MCRLSSLPIIEWLACYLMRLFHSSSQVPEVIAGVLDYRWLAAWRSGRSRRATRDRLPMRSRWRADCGRGRFGGHRVQIHASNAGMTRESAVRFKRHRNPDGE